MGLLEIYPPAFQFPVPALRSIILIIGGMMALVFFIFVAAFLFDINLFTTDGKFKLRCRYSGNKQPKAIKQAKHLLSKKTGKKMTKETVKLSKTLLQKVAKQEAAKKMTMAQVQNSL